jgi:hypothetical protein
MDDRDQISKKKAPLKADLHRTTTRVRKVKAIAAVSGCGPRYPPNAPHNPQRSVPLHPHPETKQTRNQQIPNANK